MPAYHYPAKLSAVVYPDNGVERAIIFYAWPIRTNENTVSFNRLGEVTNFNRLWSVARQKANCEGIGNPLNILDVVNMLINIQIAGFNKIGRAHV